MKQLRIDEELGGEIILQIEDDSLEINVTDEKGSSFFDQYYLKKKEAIEFAKFILDSFNASK